VCLILVFDRHILIRWTKKPS